MTYVTERKREMSDCPVATSPLCPDQLVGFEERKCINTLSQKPMTGHMTFFFLSQINNILNKKEEESG